MEFCIDPVDLTGIVSNSWRTYYVDNPDMRKRVEAFSRADNMLLQWVTFVEGTDKILRSAQSRARGGMM
jgi:hypothetical protein